MKKNLGFLIVISCLTLTCCQPSTKDEAPAHVRFVNGAGGNLFWQFGGSKFGDAIFLGELYSGYATPYKDTKPGTYGVELQTINGQWVQASTGQMQIDSGKYLTIYFVTTNPVTDGAGNLTGYGSFYFQTAVASSP